MRITAIARIMLDNLLLNVHDQNHHKSMEYWTSSLQEPKVKEQQKEIWGKDGVRYQRHGGFILSPQNYPDAVNISNFPPCILYPGQVYAHDVTYKFGLLSENLDMPTWIFTNELRTNSWQHRLYATSHLQLSFGLYILSKFCFNIVLVKQCFA